MTTFSPICRHSIKFHHPLFMFAVPYTWYCFTTYPIIVLIFFQLKSHSILPLTTCQHYHLRVQCSLKKLTPLHHHVHCLRLLLPRQMTLHLLLELAQHPLQMTSGTASSQNASYLPTTGKDLAGRLARRSVEHQHSSLTGRGTAAFPTALGKTVFTVLTVLRSPVLRWSLFREWGISCIFSC